MTAGARRSLLLDSPIGHDHFWRRAAVSRRTVLRAGAVGAGAAMLTPLLPASPAWAVHGVEPDGGIPRPIPGGFDAFGQTFHVEDPSVGGEPNVLTDFDGFVAVGLAGGKGHGLDGEPLFFEVDNRFFSGKFVGTDGKTHHGTFGFF
jgi:hypothetical protein